MSENNPTDNATDLRLCQGRDVEATTSTSTGARAPRGKNAQYYRDYRARKRAEQEKESLNRAGSQALADVTGEEIDYCERPVILAGDFNVNFSLPVAETLLAFLKDKFGLEMINGRNDPTTKGGTTIDAVFARNIEKIELKHFVSYFSYHNPIVNVIDLDISPLENDN